MPKYLLKVSYTIPGMKGVLEEGGSARKNVAEKAIQSVGGRLESFYFAFGESDVYVIADYPDQVSAASAAMHISASGGAAVETVVLLTTDEIDRASGIEVDYVPPGA